LHLYKSGDERFDFSAIGRIFCGLCQVGAWGCFDEFNRLEERVLSAVSQQILSIQRGLIERRSSIELLGKTINLHENVGIFVTMNPGYAGRRNLPDNLKNLFRSVAMVVPDKRLIAQVLLFSQGFIGANFLAERVVTFFECCERDMSKCCHYDFGLRALKVMLNSAGSLWRRVKNQVDWKVVDANIKTSEVSLIVEALGNNILPKVVNDDVPVFNRILCEVFPGSTIQTSDDKKLKEHLMVTCASKRLVHGQEWIQKVLQLKLVIDMRHGVIVVGSVASGKSSAIRALQEAMEKVDGIRVELYVIEPKVVDKQHLYGELDSTTMEWRDGIFTHIIRTIILNQKGEFDRRHWIVFDGDIDPEWAENLNSVLDDNKILTLPSGERLNIPENVRLIFEVDNLLNATPATVSRCGLIWMGNTAISDEMRLLNLFDCLDPASVAARNGYSQSFLDAVRPMIISSNGAPTLVSDALDFVMNVDHVMTPTRESLLISMGALLSRGLDVLRDYNDGHPDFPMEGNHLVMFARRWLLHSLLWGFAGSCTLSTREKFSDFLSKSANEYLPDKLGANLFDYRVMVENGEYEAWSTSVPRIEFESTNKVSDTDFVVPTTDTTRHIHIIESYVMSRLPLIRKCIGYCEIRTICFLDNYF
jgi:dynein heavy chain 1